jgi:hypothetical protein
MSTIALGVTNLIRTAKLKSLLESVPRDLIDRAIIADNGEIGELERELYNRDWGFEITVLDLPYNSGIGFCRRQIADELQEDHLLILDNDMVVDNNINKLYRILESLPEFGGVSGILLEDGILRGPGVNYHTKTIFGNRVLYIHNYEVNYPVKVGSNPVFEFDQIPQASIIRKECLETYKWDEDYETSREHGDFFVGQKKNGNWRFGVTPSVIITHNPGGGDEYMDMRNETIQDHKRFIEKWEYDYVIYGDSNWLVTVGELEPSSTTKKAYNNMPIEIQLGLKKIYRRFNPL